MMSKKTGHAMFLVVALIVTACGADSETAETTTTEIAEQTTTSVVEETTTTTAATTTTTIAAEPIPLRDVEGGTKSGLGWLAEPELYVAYVGGRTLTLDMPEAFTYIPRPSDLILAPADIPPGIQIISFAITPIQGVVQPDQVGAQHDGSTISEVTQPAPEDLSDWLDEVSQMNTSSLTDAKGAGWVAKVWDTAVDATAGETFSCPYGQCIATLVPEGADPYIAGDGFAFRMWQFGDVADGLYGFAQTPMDQVSAAEDFYNMVLSGLTIED